MRTLSLLVFASFSLLLTSCITPSGTPHAWSWNTGTGKVTTGNTVTEPQTPIILEHASLSGVILSSEAADTLRAKYASGVSRTYIPYMVFGSGDLSLMDVSVWFTTEALTRPYGIMPERWGESFQTYVEWIQNTQVSHYEDTLWLTQKKDLDVLRDVYQCITMQGVVHKSWWSSWVFTEISAVANIPRSSVENPFQVPLVSPVYFLWSGKTLTGVTAHNGQFIMPTEYRKGGDVSYFMNPLTRVLSYGGVSRVSPWPDLYYPLSLRDCTVDKNTSSYHYTLYMVPPEGFPSETGAWKDFRPLLEAYRVGFPSELSQNLSHVLLTLEDGKIVDMNILQIYSSDRPFPLKNAPMPQNIPLCIDTRCSLALNRWIMPHVRSLELFYDEKKEK